ncbi:MAG TPA: DUF4199 domain-containing protein [Hymenobacter sp.]|jgi:hypothetical protein|uniref:DUF4199 domain-containing protein n=1 Tax=Hymenobacter sp. TaxID=1898978 RepID=UPI002EDA64DE
MESNVTPVTSTSVGLRYGLLAGLVSIIFSFGLYAAKMENSPLKYVGSVLLVVGIVLAMREFKASNHGFMSFGQGVGIGALVSTVVGVLSAIFAYVYFNIIDPTIVERMMEKARTDMEARGGMSDEQIDAGMAMAGKFMNGPMMMLIVVLSSVLLGVVLSLIISAFIKHSKPEFE